MELSKLKTSLADRELDDSSLEMFQDFREQGKALVEAIASYWESIEKRNVTPSLENPIYMPEISDVGIGLDESVAQVRHIFDHSLAKSHPLYLGLVNSSPLPQAVLGDLIVSSLDNNGGASHQGPAHVAAEKLIVAELQRRIDYSGDGLFLPGGTYVNHQALMLARQFRYPAWSTEGPMAIQSLPRLYVSDSVHFCMHRAAVSLGFGKNSLVEVRTDRRGKMDCGHLRQMIEQDLADGFDPFCVVATAGTTGTGAVDDLVAVNKICKEMKLWFHVDTCYGGAVLLSDRYRHLIEGINQADSVALDMHKWFFAPLVAGVLLTKHTQLQIDTFAVNASYIPSQSVEPYCKGFPTSRRSTALGVWFGLRASGWNVIRDAVERNIELTRYMEDRLREKGFVVMPDGELSIACVRWEPEGMKAGELDQLQVDISAAVRKNGDAWFATTNHHDLVWMRLNMVNLHTRQNHVDQLVDVMTRTAQRMAA